MPFFSRQRHLIAPCLLTVLLAILPAWARADEPPAGAMFETARDLRRDFAAGQFTNLLDIHLLQYSADVSWHADWARARYEKNGLRFETGSMSTRDLYGAFDVTVNIPVGGSTRLRYDRRSFRDHRFESTHEHLEIHGAVAPGLSIVVAGMPASRKEYSRAGAGLHLGSPAGSGYLQLLAMSERPLYNLKHRAGYVYVRKPLRYVIDGYLGHGRWRFFGTSSLGSRYEIREADLTAPSLAARGQGYQSQGELGAIWQVKGWQAGAEMRAAARFVDRLSDQEAESFSFDRRWLQAHVYGRRDWRRRSLKLLTGVALQRDVFDFADRRGGRYNMRAVLWGWEAGWRPGPRDELRLGYMANWFRMERRSSASADLVALVDRQEKGYTDKVHVKWLHNFAPRVALELLASHELMQGSFGGFSAKGIFLF